MLSLVILALLLPVARAHAVPWSKGMYCFNGTRGVDNPNNSDPAVPLFNLTFSDWWMHHTYSCDERPPAPGDFLELPAGGSFTVEIAPNRAKTSFSYGGKYRTEWGDGKDHPDDYHDPNCIKSPNMHAQNRTMAAGSAFAISYQSDIKKVTPENLVVFTVRHNTPFKLLATFDVPARLPACPPGGCICAWGWVPNHCGQPNMYMSAYKCRVNNAIGLAPLARPQAPVWCEDDQSKCVRGAKQMIYWQQLDGNNVFLEGNQKEGNEKSPGYNHKMGFLDGAQDDIFNDSAPPVRHYERPMIVS